MFTDCKMTREDTNMIYSFKSYATKICNDSHNAEDLIQNIFLKILTNPEKFDSLQTHEKRQYVLMSIHNQVIDRHRILKAKGRVRYYLPVEESQAAIKPDVYGKLALKEVMKKGKTYKHFPTLMLQVYGYNSYEIADMTHTNLMTVLGRFRYTRTFLNK